MNRKQLRLITDQRVGKERQERATAFEEERQKILKDADEALRKAAHDGLSEVVVCTVSDMDEHLIQIPSAGTSSWEDDQETIRRAEEVLKSLGINCLRGAAAELRDKLKHDELYLRLRMRVEGHGCKGTYCVWDLIASW